GISGISTKKRENFHRMINDAAAGRFDYIITKEISRFARNTLDSIQYTRQLLNNGVAVYFQNDNINTLDEDSEFRLTIMAGVAQDEIRKLSSRVKFGHRQAIKNGVVMGNSWFYGYDKRDGKLFINESEAEMIRLIFSLYATGEYSTPKIEALLWDKGYRNHNGEMINRRVIGNIIKNPKYKGYYCGNKVRIVDLFSKKQQFLDEDDWVMWKDDEGLTVPAIVDEETWAEANRIFQTRSQGMKTKGCSYKANNPFTGKIFCVEHDVTYYLKARKGRNGENTGTLVCSHRIKNGACSCSSFPIRESEMLEIVRDILTYTYQNVEEITQKYLGYVNECSNPAADSRNELKAIDAEIKKIEAKKEKLLELSLDGSLSNAEFKRRNKVFNDDIKKLEKQRTILNADKPKAKNDPSKLVSTIKERISRHISDGTLVLTKASIDNMIEKIYIAPTGKNEADVQIILRSGGSAKYALNENFNKKTVRIFTNAADTAAFGASCPENTLKKMIEAQEKQMAGK
ncbi:MAG: recombinase family protein, partial [Firmicutes bacterium]|nr:recombinase family protein [Bacillota bacterium]